MPSRPASAGEQGIRFDHQLNIRYLHSLAWRSGAQVWCDRTVARRDWDFRPGEGVV